MKPESIKIYTRRIASANKSEIIVILYDIIGENLAEAEEALEKGKMEEGKKSLKEAIRFVKELLLSLDMKYEISGNLASLYIYITRCLNFALVNGKIEEIQTAREMINRLSNAFLQVSKQDDSEPLMENTEQLFAGFTYGKNLGLSETMVDDRRENRGYRV